MQIHELNNMPSAPTENDVLAIDTGSETYKIGARALSGVLVLEKSSFSSLPFTISDSRITSDMVCIKAELGTPSAQTADWTVTTSNGSLTVGPSGAISGSTTLRLYLASSK